MSLSGTMLHRNRGDLASNLTTSNPVIKDGEIVVEHDTGRKKVGFGGNKKWNNLPYDSDSDNEHVVIASKTGFTPTLEGGTVYVTSEKKLYIAWKDADGSLKLKLAGAEFELVDGKIPLELLPSQGTTASVVSTVTVGAVNVGSSIPENTTLDQLVVMIFDKTYDPVVVQPSVSFSGSTGEVGVSFIPSASLNRGTITGIYNNGVWNGAATDYASGVAGAVAYDVSEPYVYPAATQSIKATIPHGIGAMPKNSKGADKSSLQVAAGSVEKTVGFTGQYKAYYAASSTENKQSSIINEATIKELAAGPLLPAVVSAFTINVPTTTKTVLICIPNSMKLDKVFSTAQNSYVYQDGDNSPLFLLAVDTVSMYSGATAYKVYYTNFSSSPSASFNFNVTTKAA